MSGIQTVQARLRQKLASLPAIKEAALADGATDEQIAAYDAALDDIEKEQKHLDRLEREETLKASTSIPITPAITTTERIPAVAAIKVNPLEKFGIICAGMVKAREEEVPPFKWLDENGYGELVKELRSGYEYDRRMGKAAPTPSVNIVNGSSSGGVLVPSPLAGSIIELLRPTTTFFQGGPRQVQFVGGKYHQARGATGATAGYVGEGEKKPLSAPTFEDINMQAKKLATIVPITQEARMWTIGGLEQYIRDDATKAMSEKIDLTAYFGSGVGNVPQGIFNKPGTIRISATGFFANSTSPTLIELDKMASRMILQMTVRNIAPSESWAWVMNLRTAMYLGSIRTAQGEYAFDEMRGFTNLRWMGFRVLVSNQFPINLGSGGEDSMLGLIDFSQVLYGDEGSMIIKFSDVATLDSSGTLIHLWQQNMMAWLFEHFHDFGLRHNGAVVILDDVAWNANVDDISN